jgi:hypothetical protein
MHTYFRDILEAKRKQINLLLANRIDSFVSKQQFFFDHRFMKINLGRGMGHTTFIKEAARPDDIVFMSKGYKKPQELMLGVKFFHGVEMEKLCGMRFEGITVFLDQGGHTTNDYEELLYLFRITNSYPDIFVVLQ